MELWILYKTILKNTPDIIDIDDKEKFRDECLYNI